MMSQDEAHTAALKKKLIDDTKSCFQGEKLVKFHTQNARIFHKKKLFFSLLLMKKARKSWASAVTSPFPKIKSSPLAQLFTSTQRMNIQRLLHESFPVCLPFIILVSARLRLLFFRLAARPAWSRNRLLLHSPPRAWKSFNCDPPLNRIITLCGGVH
jgi:hypothetical protein